jgi:hypothetical protein
MSSSQIWRGALCPRCRKKIEFKNDKLFCKPCGTDYPSLNGIPWLFSDPQSTLGEWKNRSDYYIQLLSAESAQIEGELREPGLLAQTKERLTRVKDLKRKQIEAIRDLLQPLGLLAKRPKEFHQGVQTELPQGQQLNSYHTNLHRDWVWGDEENKASLKIVQSVIGSHSDLGRTVVLGGGGCRLPYDIHREFKVDETIVVDINPLLILAAQKIISGQKLGLVEFPVAPINLESTAVLQDCKAPGAVTTGFNFLFADATDLPFEQASFETLITPWLVDIVPQDPALLFKRFNNALKMNGRWIYFGSLAFSHKKFSRRYSLEETLELAKNSGFQIKRFEQQKIPYLQSPHSSHGRIETVLGFSAQKVSEVEKPEPYRYLPEWLTDTRQPVPHLDFFKSQSFVSRVQLEVLSMVDGKKSISSMATMMAGHYKMTPLEAEVAVRVFLTKIFEQNLFESV